MSDRRYSSNAVVLNNLKQAALYFDRVIPLNAFEFTLYPNEIIREGYGEAEYARDLAQVDWVGLKENKLIIKNLLFKDTAVSNNGLVDALELIEEASRTLKYKYFIDAHEAFVNAQYSLPHYHYEQLGFLTADIIRESPTLIGKNAREIASDLSRSLGLVPAALIIPRWVGSAGEDLNSPIYETTFKSPLVIDPTHLDWEQIIEIRRDSESCGRLRRFRLFLHETYEGKHEEFVLDDIASRVEDFKLAIKKHGIATKSSWISIICDTSKNAQTLAGQAALWITGGALQGGLPGLITSVVGCLVSTGAAVNSSCLKVRKIRDEYASLLRDFPLSHLVPVEVSGQVAARHPSAAYSASLANSEIARTASIHVTPGIASSLDPEGEIYRWMFSQEWKVN